MSEIAVIGAGAWGTAISVVLGRKKTHNVGSGRTKSKSATASLRLA